MSVNQLLVPNNYHLYADLITGGIINATDVIATDDVVCTNLIANALIFPNSTKGAILVADGNDYEPVPVGADDEILVADSLQPSGVKWASVGSIGGDVDGPASATDNAIARFDGITGKLIQDSVNGILEDDGSVRFGTAHTTGAGTNYLISGINNTVTGNYALASGSFNTASGPDTHVEGTANSATNNSAHAEGTGNTASGTASHAEGTGTTASGDNSHAEGQNNVASGNQSHAAGENATAGHDNSYVWSDGTAFGSTTTDEYSIRAGNGVRINNGAATELITATQGTATTWSYTPGTSGNWPTVPTNLAQALDLTGVWQAWVPTFTNFTKGSATITSRYTQIGKTINAQLQVVLAADSVVSGNITFSLPKTAQNSLTIPIGSGRILDAGSQAFAATIVKSGNLNATVEVFTTAAAHAGVANTNATTPMTWTTSDSFNCTITYEAV